VNYCYAWDFTNDTGEDADDLHIWLQGVRQVTEVYAGSENPFGLPTAGSGYNAGLNAYHLEFTGGPAFAGDTVRLGVCTAAPTLRLSATDTTPPFYWSAQGRVLQPAPLFAGLSWEWHTDGSLRLSVHNAGTAPLVLWSLDVLTAEQPLALDDLNDANLSGLAVAAALVTEPITITAGGAHVFDIAAAALFGGGAWLAELTITDEDDLAHEAHLFSQAVPPSAVIYMPTFLKS
jgi:hypothetical protein